MSEMSSLLAGWPWRNLVLAVIHTLWQGPIIAALLWILLRGAPAKWAHLRYLAALCALGAIVFAGMVTWSVLDRGGFSGGSYNSTSVAEQPQEPLINSATPPSSAAPLTSPATIIPWTTWAGCVWASGVALMLFRATAGAARAQHWAARGTPLHNGPLAERVTQVAIQMRLRRPIRLLVHDQWISPAVVGFIFPTLLLPASIMSNLPAAHLQMVLVHELAHIRRWDYLVNFCQQVIESILFFNPAIWWVSKQVRAEREACCDAWAVRVTGPREAACTLAGFAQRLTKGFLPPSPAMAITGESGSLLNRIKRIVRPNDRPAISAPWYGAIAAIVGAFIFLGVLRAGADVAVTTAQSLLTPAQRIDKIAEVRQSQTPSLDPSQMIEVSGTVHSADGSPLPVHEVWTFLITPNAGTSGSIKISHDGTFSGKMKPGEISLMLNPKGFAPTFAGPFTPDADGMIPPVQMVLQRGFTATIRVVDPSGKPIAGAKVKSVFIEHFEAGQQTHTTAADGIISLANSTSQIPIQLDVTADGFEFERQTVPLAEGQITTVILPISKPTTGTVVDSATGLPISGATISWVQRKGFADEMHPPHYSNYESPPVIATTGHNGKFALTTLRSDCEYVMWVSAPNHGSELFEGIHPGQLDLTWKLGPPRMIRGRITGDLSKLPAKPIVEYSFMLHLPGTDYGYAGSLKVAIANGVGTFEFPDPPPAQITLSLSGKRITVDTANIPPLIEINLDRQSQTAQPAVAKRTVLLKFDLPKDAPPPRGTLRIIPLDPDINAYMTPDDIPVHDGQVRYEAPAPGKIAYQGQDLLGYWILDKQGIDVPPGTDPLEVHIPVIPAGAVHGTLCNADGTPQSSYFFVSIVEVAKSPALGNQFAAYQTFNSRDGTGNFFISPLPLDGAYQFVAVSGSQITWSPILSIDAKNPIQNVALKFVDGKPLRATIFDPDGHPQPSLKVSLSARLTHGGSYGIGQQSTDGNGTVLFEHVNPDVDCTYVLQLRPRGDYANQDVPVKIDGNPVKVNLTKGYALHGQVINVKTGKPMANATVSAWPQGPQSIPERIQTVSDKDGKFAFTNLDQENYQLQVDGTIEADAIIEHTPGGTTQFSYPNGVHPIVARGGQMDPIIVRVQPQAQ